MNTQPESYVVIPNFTNYAIHPNGTVKRVVAATRGRSAGKIGYDVQPVIHPKGHLWCVQLTGDDGVRKRIPVKRLMEQIFGMVS